MAQRKYRLVALRLTEAQLKQWKSQAETAGVSLSQWIRFKCEGVVLIRTTDKVA